MADASHVHEQWLHKNPQRGSTKPSRYLRTDNRRRRVIARGSVFSGLLAGAFAVYLLCQGGAAPAAHRGMINGAGTPEGLRVAEQMVKATYAAALSTGAAPLLVSASSAVKADVPAATAKGSEASPETAAAGKAESARLGVHLTAAMCRKAAERIDPEMMQLLPNKFVDSVKRTPCWEVAGKLRCLPSFYLAGGFHSGAGTLTTQLMAHPDIMTGQSSNSQFWAEFGKDPDGYISGFDAITKSIRQAPDTKVLMDHSLSTFAFYWSAGTRAHPGFRKTMETCWVACIEKSGGDAASQESCMSSNCFQTAQEADRKVSSEAGISFDDAHVPLLMHAAYGDWPVKMVVLLRNPVDRLHSAFWAYPHYKGKYGATAQGFAEYVDEQLTAFERCTKQHNAAKCALYFESLGMEFENVFYHADQVIRGVYSVFLERWLRHIPREQMLVIRSEDYFPSTEKTVQKVFQFLGLDAPADMTGVLEAGRRVSYTGSAPEMLPHTLKQLREFYKPFNVQLAELLGNNSWLQWNNRS